MAHPTMQIRRNKKLRRIPHILLLIDTAGAYGRGIVEGVGRYAAENGPWSIQYEYRAMDSLPPEWLKQWRGDGIITRTAQRQAGEADPGHSCAPGRTARSSEIRHRRSQERLR